MSYGTIGIDGNGNVSPVPVVSNSTTTVRGEQAADAEHRVVLQENGFYVIRNTGDENLKFGIYTADVEDGTTPDLPDDFKYAIMLIPGQTESFKTDSSDETKVVLAVKATTGGEYSLTRY